MRRSFLRLVSRRLAAAAPGLAGVVVVTFCLMRALPGDPAAYFAGNAATKEAIEQVRVKLGLDKSLPEQFVSYVRDLARANLGQSVTTGQPVRAEMFARLPASLELTLTALLLAVAVALPAGVLAATRPGSWVDQAVRVLTTAGVSLPTFFTGILLVYVFFYLLGWSPSPTGRLDSLFPAPPRVTSFYLLDSLIARDIETFRACLRPLAPDGLVDLRLSQRHASRGDHSRHDLLLHARGQRARGEGVRVAGHRLLRSGVAPRLGLCPRAGVHPHHGHPLCPPQPHHRHPLRP